MMTTGSVRGKCCALQDGQSRRQPAWTGVVRFPQLDESVSQVPTEERFGLRERRQVLAVDKALARRSSEDRLPQILHAL